MMELLKDILQASGIFLMITPFATVIVLLIDFVVSKALDKLIGTENKENN